MNRISFCSQYQGLAFSVDPPKNRKGKKGREGSLRVEGFQHLNWRFLFFFFKISNCLMDDVFTHARRARSFVFGPVAIWLRWYEPQIREIQWWYPFESKRPKVWVMQPRFSGTSRGDVGTSSQGWIPYLWWFYVVFCCGTVVPRTCTVDVWIEWG